MVIKKPVVVMRIIHFFLLHCICSTLVLLFGGTSLVYASPVLLPARLGLQQQALGKTIGNHKHYEKSPEAAVRAYAGTQEKADGGLPHKAIYALLQEPLEPEWILMDQGARPAYAGIQGGTTPVCILRSESGQLYALPGQTGSDFLHILRPSNASHPESIKTTASPEKDTGGEALKVPPDAQSPSGSLPLSSPADALPGDFKPREQVPPGDDIHDSKGHIVFISEHAKGSIKTAGSLAPFGFLLPGEASVVGVSQQGAVSPPPRPLRLLDYRSVLQHKGPL